MTDYKEKYQEAKKLISEQKKVIKKQENFIEGPPRSRTGGESASCDNRDAETKKIGLAGDCLRALYDIRWVTLISRRRPRGGR